MKQTKLLLSAFAILAIVGTTLAFKAHSYFGNGSVYCNGTCPAQGVIAFATGTGANQTTTPCGEGVQPFIITGTPAACTATGAGTLFIPTIPGE